MAKIICFDIDGVLTVEADTNHADLAGSYIYRSPNKRAKQLCLKAYDSGLTVVLFTGRREAHRRITEDWLSSHGFHYHYLLMCKPYYSWIIEDRVLGVTVDEQLDLLEKLIDCDGETVMKEYASKLGQGIETHTDAECRQMFSAMVTKEKASTKKESKSLLPAITNELLDLIAQAISRGSQMSFDTLGLNIGQDSWNMAWVYKSDGDARSYLLNTVVQWFREELLKRIDLLKEPFEKKESSEAETPS